MEHVPDAISSRVIEAIMKVKRIPVENITLDSRLQDLGMDSLDGLNLFFELEEMFDITIPDDQARSMHSVREIVDGLTRMLQNTDVANDDQVRA